MIKIIINGDDRINSIEIKGHANFNDYGKDIVCASVSSIATTTVNALLRLNKDIKFESDEGYLMITINSHDEVVDELINNMINLLEQLQNQYKKNIKIGRCHR